MSSVVIVAIPVPDDPVWRISSEKIPHLTLLYLGESDGVDNQNKIVEFLEHAARVSLHRFSLDVDRRGILGDDEADVVFFQGWDLPELKQFRAYLLQEPNIAKAHLSVEKFPEWLPHLTLGYPKKPAAKPKDFHDRVTWVQFDRIAIWTDNYEGPEFQLKNYEWEAVSMGMTVDQFLEHYGTKGMKWGVRRSSNGAARRAAKTAPQDVTVKMRNGQIHKTAGGSNQPAAADAIKAKKAVQKLKKSGTDALTTQELKELSERLNLEQQVSRLAKDQTTSAGVRIVSNLLEDGAKK